jgi:hypothetical protein
MCSKRKRAPVDPALQAESLDRGSASAVAAAWGQRLRSAPATIKAGDLYGGRGFVEAKLAASHLGAPLSIVSAGLGLVDATTDVPSYCLTTAPRDRANILSKTGGPSSEWWAQLQNASPYWSRSTESETGLMLAALSAGYVAMVSEEWSRWPADRLARLRLFTKEKPSGAAEALLASWMPYDDRLDAAGGDLAGTDGDFAQRALRHFAATLGGSSSAAEDRASVARSLEGLSVRTRPRRPRLSDEAVMGLIHEHWTAVDGRSGAMLRHLRRSLGFGCEQGRFKVLFHSAAAQRAGSAR